MTGTEGNMKQLLLTILITLLLAWYISARGPHQFGCRPWFSPAQPPPERAGHRVHRAFARTGREFREAVHETGHEVGEAWSELGEDLGDWFHETAEGVHDAIGDDSEAAPPRAGGFHSSPAHPRPPAPPASAHTPEHVLAEAPLPPQSPACSSVASSSCESACRRRSGVQGND